MNRKTLIAVVSLLIFSLALTACRKKNNAPETTEVVTEAAVNATETTSATVETLEVILDPQVEDWEDENTESTEETEATKVTEATEPQETTKPEETEPEETEKPIETQPAVKDSLAQEYENYLNMTPEQQQAVFEEMGPEKFMEWFAKAKAAYEASQDYIDISGGEIDLSKLG